MATTTYSRHPVSYGSHQKALPVTLPPSGKGPIYTQPISRVADAPDFSDSSTSYSSSGRSGGSFSVRSGSSYAGSHSGTDYESHYSRPGIDVVDELSERMNSAFDPIRMDKSLAKQAQTSGELNAKQRELRELQAMAQRRLGRARVNFAEGVEAAKEARRDVEYTSKKISSMKSKAEKKHPEAYAKASRSRHA
ncbi:hypothetical protein A1O7_07826 [Cladophialophora yegresii CBS 114405]|uniref:Biogenesis of lysosome-related organelles complex 1 subunit KXD1 n=1 Tax=Cladophialophora yegresii CBS 114405 TaxID=1182544 RepID=W9VPL1_9EURO|nr:uncharacterized protein A1O7_07826 [Cladophialophora yegresii CBS 114405]EXJ57478.1 hypothetical protein A1O7_07826 [Cladophialophora yegresii CBS 114405]